MATTAAKKYIHSIGGVVAEHPSGSFVATTLSAAAATAAAMMQLIQGRFTGSLSF